MDAELICRLLERDIVQLDFSIEQHQADILRLLRKYRDLPISLADACLIRLSELTDSCLVFTTDVDFLVYRRKGRHVIPALTPYKR